MFLRPTRLTLTDSFCPYPTRFRSGAGDVGPRVLEAIGAEVIPLFCEIDGSFPNHHPDPSEPGNLKDLIDTVARFEADLGIAFDGDGDRLGVVTRDGQNIFADRLLMLLDRKSTRLNSSH